MKILRGEKEMTIKEIISNAGMSTRPEYYSGRGAIRCDLSEKHLEKIYQGIKEHYGEDAANNFVSMVESMKELSATAFLNELYSLANRDFKFERIAGHSGFDFSKDENGNYNEAQLFASMASAMFNRRDETEMIRGTFLANHGRKTKGFPAGGYFFYGE